MNELEGEDLKATGRVGRALRGVFRGIPLRTLESFYFQLGTMLTSGVSIRVALLSLAEQGRGRVREILEDISNRVSAGERLAPALEAHPDAFDGFAVAMVRSGELAGRLDENLKLLGRAAEHFRKTRSMVITGLIYPIILLHLGILIPNAIVLVKEGLLPYLSACLGTLMPVYAVVFLIWFAHRLLRPTRWYARVSLGMIFSGKVVTQIALARFSRALAALYDAGVDLGTAVDIAGEASSNVAFREAFGTVAEQVRAGNSLSDSIAGAPYVTELARNMIRTGEHTGRLGETLDKLAEFYDQESRTAIERVARIAPIVVYLVIAAYIAVRVIGFYGGIYSYAR